MTIVCYHAIQPSWVSPMSIEPTAFAAHCEWFGRHRRVLPLAEAVQRLDGSFRLPRGVAALTFDDGFASLYEHAVPLLRRHRLPATVFLVAGTLSVPGHQVDWVDTPPDYPLRTLQLEQIREMQSAGIGFESHSLHHADLTSLSFADCVEDLRSSRELLETLLGHDVRMLAYPRGRHSADVRRAAQRAGYSHAFTLPESREPVGRYAIPRVGLYRGNNAPNLRIKLSRPYLSVRTSRVFEIRRRAGRVGAAAR